MADNAIILKVIGKDEASGTFEGVQRSAQKVAASMGSAFKVGGLVAAGGIAAAGVALVGFIKKAAEEQVGIAQLTTAIGTLDAAHRGHAASVEDVVRAREKLAFADDEIRASLAALIPATGDYEEAVKRQRVAMDLARGTGMDLAMASKIVGKISDENIQVLKRYGITLKDGASEQEALAEIQAKFAGQSEKFAGTATAKWQIFNNQLDNIKETIGAALLPLATKLGEKLSDFLIKHQPEIERLSQLFAEKLAGAIEGIAKAIERAMPTLQKIFAEMKTGFETIKPALQWILSNKVALTAAIVAIGIALILAFTPVTLPILAVVAALGGLLFAIGFVRNHWEEILGKLQDALVGFKDWILDHWKQIVLGILAVVFPPGAGLFYLVTHFNEIKDKLLDAAGVIRDGLLMVWGAIAGGADSAFNGAKGIITSVLDFLQDRIRDLLIYVKQALDAIPGPNPAGNALQGAIDALTPAQPPLAPGTRQDPSGQITPDFGLGRAAAMAGPVAYVTINATGGDGEQIAAHVARALRDQLGMDTLRGQRLPMSAYTARR